MFGVSVFKSDNFSCLLLLAARGSAQWLRKINVAVYFIGNGE
jgi:hypothetical protein